jgi:DNA (cytosine-5)-methyltransferase 1
LQNAVLEPDNLTRFHCVDAFAGAGGLSLGLRSAGFDLTYAFDANDPAIATYKHNLGSHAEVRLVETVTASMLHKYLPKGVERLDLLAGGPPCQGFSKQKRGAHNGDGRNRLILEFVRLIKDAQPKYFLLENVAMFGQKRGKRYASHVLDELSGSYRFYPHFYNSADYGLAQTRERFIMVGESRDLPPRFTVPFPTVKKWATVGEVLTGLPEPPDNYGEHPAFANHYRAKVTQPNIYRFSFVPQGGGWQDIPMKHRLPCHQVVDTSSGGWPDVYGRLRWDGQCPTLTAGFDSFTRGRYGHPLQDRPLTPREAARLQGFPDHFRFVGTRWDVRLQIGNAVPPPLAEVIGDTILKALRGELNEHGRHGDQTVLFSLGAAV